MQIRGGGHQSEETGARRFKGLVAVVGEILSSVNRRSAVSRSNNRKRKPVHSGLLTSDGIVAAIIATAQATKRNATAEWQRLSLWDTCSVHWIRWLLR